MRTRKGKRNARCATRNARCGDETPGAVYALPHSTKRHGVRFPATCLNFTFNARKVFRRYLYRLFSLNALKAKFDPSTCKRCACAVRRLIRSHAVRAVRYACALRSRTLCATRHACTCHTLRATRNACTRCTHTRHALRIHVRTLRATHAHATRYVYAIRARGRALNFCARARTGLIKGLSHKFSHICQLPKFPRTLP